MLNKLSRLLEQAGISLTDHQKNQLVAYVDMLNKWNKAYNLTSVRDPNEMLIRHILDSIVVAPYLNGERFIDVGTGPGLPGVPLSIVRPESHFTLLDSARASAYAFYAGVQHELKLENITPVQSRVEEFPAEPPFDGVISRAFASLNDMVSWCKHLPAEKGRFYALKGQLPGDEIEQLPDGFVVESIEKLQIPQLEGERHLVIIKPNTF
ncbi:16S rRNA (guanine(527)-N(7))-methyltransferase RsmG [Enterobacter hormaechei]|uniref:Ribosomal RNA small subunit methyltransferase G n=3 Tax=Enterobacter cloacae complex TaxID=354276 RepID=A0A927DHE7_9ENTR|nr:16S rRNA (guanine(527)-N(7))-methyltransferase RsmG [Enterobacter hormaechei]MBD3707120.1 16S rRNA (guanine(527)-N(7))-methyltransferase RsmG [Enterobacter hormaechei]